MNKRNETCISAHQGKKGLHEKPAGCYEHRSEKQRNVVDDRRAFFRALEIFAANVFGHNSRGSNAEADREAHDGEGDGEGEADSRELGGAKQANEECVYKAKRKHHEHADNHRQSHTD